MTVIPPLLDILLSLRLEMQMGRSVANALDKILSERPDLYSKSLRGWMARILAGQESRSIASLFPGLNETPTRRSFLCLLERGLKGSSIDSHLGELENEFYFTVEQGFEKKLQLLPLKLLMPLTLFILPGVMLLLIGPLLRAISLF
jgi:hypothetical protein